MDSQAQHNKRERFIAYVLEFLFTLAISIPAYVNSTFLAKWTGEEWLGVLYAVAYVITLVGFSYLPTFLTRVGNYRMLSLMIVLEFLSLVGLAVSPSLWLIAISFVAGAVAVAIANANMDIFVENFSTDQDAGVIRGFFNTSSNLAIVISPVLAGLILRSNSYSTMFLVSAAILIPTYLIVRRYVRDFKDPAYQKMDLWSAAKEIFAVNDLRDVFMCDFILQFFYAWMVIYTPLYLYNYVGFSWTVIGAILSVTLIPFIFIEIPLGLIADSRFGEKEAMTIGLIIMGISTGAIAYINTHSIATWMILLFITRIGAAMLESMCETYFFKKVDSSKAHLIGAWHTLRPVAYVIGPILASAFLLAFNLKYIFLLLGFIILYGVRYSLALKDTK